VALLVAGSLASSARVPAADLVARIEPGRVVVAEAGGAPVARFVFADPAVGRPALRDLHGPGGVLVTRPCPPRPGIDADDHATMHPGVMLCFSDLSGADPWRHKTAVRVTSCSAGAGEGGAATILCTSEYLGTATDRPDSAPVCRERSRITIADRVTAGHAVRVVTWDGELTADRAPVVFGDVEEMGLGIRLIRELSPRGGGRYLASHGGRDEQGVFGKPAAWVDAAGTIDGGRHGVLLMGGRDQPRPSRFHARDTGWLLANPFGSRAYGAPEAGGATLAPGAALRLHFTLVLHGDIPDDDVGVVAAAIIAAR
jgi:hypothetical protein